MTNEEIKLLMEIGSETGIFHVSEGYMVANVLQLDELRVGAIMTPSNEMYVVDLAGKGEDIRNSIIWKIFRGLQKILIITTGISK